MVHHHDISFDWQFGRNEKILKIKNKREEEKSSFQFKVKTMIIFHFSVISTSSAAPYCTKVFLLLVLPHLKRTRNRYLLRIYFTVDIKKCLKFHLQIILKHSVFYEDSKSMQAAMF